MENNEIENLIKMLSRLPGVGPRSARRVALFMLKNKEGFMIPLSDAIAKTADKMLFCETCGNLDTSSICGICSDNSRDRNTICVVEDVADLWAIERSATYKGKYHVLGGVLSAIDGIHPSDISMDKLITRTEDENITEVIMALSATVDGQTTAHYIADKINNKEINVSRISQGVPIGGELDYLDDGTLITAMKSRTGL
jgi:recombination protein RecR